MKILSFALQVIFFSLFSPALYGVQTLELPVGAGLLQASKLVFEVT